MKPFLNILLLFLGLSGIAQNQEIQNQIENSFPIKTVQGFDSLRPAIKKLSSPKEDHFLWSLKIFKTLKSGDNWAESNGTLQQKLLAQYYLLMYYDNHLDDNQVIPLGKKLLTEPEFMEMPESVYTLLALNASYRRKGFYRQQLNLLNRLSEQNKKFGYTVRPSTYGYFNELALVYYNLGQYTLARNNFKKQAKAFRNSDDFFRTSSMLNNIALTYAKQQKSDSALVYYKEALSLIENKPISDDYYTTEYIAHFRNVVRANIVKIDTDQNEFLKAERIFKDELASSKTVKEPRTTAQTYHDLANFYYQNGQFDIAKAYNDSTLVFEQKYSNPKGRENAYLLKAKLALEPNRNKEALQYFNLAIALKDSLTSEKEEKNYSEATAKYNFIKTGEALERNKALLKQKERTNLIQLIFLCIVILLVLIIGGMLFKVTKARKLIAIQKDALSQGLKEKEIMLDEIHHRIKNNLQVIYGILELQKGKIDSQKYAKIYEESQDYLQSISLIHELLYEQEGVTKLDMQIYLKKLGFLFIENYPNISVSYHVSALTVYMNVGKATPLALIICELITNSFKHAFDKKGSIVITLSENEGRYVLDYADDGKGFKQANNPKFYNTGLSLISMLAEDLNGEVEFFTDQGFHCRLNFET